MLQGIIMRNKLIVLVVLFCLFLTIGCTENKQVSSETTVTQTDVATPNGEGAPATKNVTENTEMKEYTLEELDKYNGNSGTIYVAYKGKVYDVSSDSYLWRNGNHKGCSAGKDITEELDKTPHGAEILNTYPVVGTLKT